jgi:hypothetical protein
VYKSNCPSIRYRQRTCGHAQFYSFLSLVPAQPPPPLAPSPYHTRPPGCRRACIRAAPQLIGRAQQVLLAVPRARAHLNLHRLIRQYLLLVAVAEF